MTNRHHGPVRSPRVDPRRRRRDTSLQRMPRLTGKIAAAAVALVALLSLYVSRAFPGHAVSTPTPSSGSGVPTTAVPPTTAAVPPPTTETTTPVAAGQSPSSTGATQPAPTTTVTPRPPVTLPTRTTAPAPIATSSS